MTEAYKRWYERMMNDPVLHKQYLIKKSENNKRYRKKKLLEKFEKQY